MAKIANPRKVFNFRIEIAGFDQFLAQTVEIPEIELEVTEHGDTNHSIKTAGRIKIGDITMEKLKPTLLPDNMFWTWLHAAQNILLGGGLLPINYKQIIIIKEMDTTGLIALNRWLCEGVFPKKISQNKLDRMSSDNVLETVVFSVDRCYRLP